MPVAIVTGASRGLGLALARALSADGWRVVADARDPVALMRATASLAGVLPVAGDVADADHRAALIDAAGEPIDVVVNNASALGPSPLPALADLAPDALERVLAVNVIAPLALVQLALPHLAPGARIVNVTSDAAVEAYPGWGGYGSAKAALDHIAAVLGAEHPDLRVYAFDPGDMRTAMHQAAFPGEAISDRADPATVAPALLRLLDERPDSGRYRAADLLATLR
jgi:NAD(P)-dependent dehydrogenase (short-subunit alcohol dehydrogenase family)